MVKPLVIILAGGSGKHFTPLTLNKTLVPLIGKPILQHTIETIENAGFSRALIVTNQDNEQWLATYQPFNITLQTHLQTEPHGMAEALLEIEREIGDQPILIINAVDCIDPAFYKTVQRATTEHDAFITVKRVSSHVTAGYVVVQDGIVTDIVEKPQAGSEPSDLVNLVIHYFRQPGQLFHAIHGVAPELDDRYERALKQYAVTARLTALTYIGDWAKLKYAYHMLDVMKHELHRIKRFTARSARVSPHAVIEGEVYIDEGAQVEAYAVIKGPTYIGRHAHIGNHALVRQSCIEEAAVVGFGSEVARSYIGPRCMLHHNFIGDSVLESQVNPSYGTTTANLRLDGKPIRMKLSDGTYIQTDKTKLGAIIATGAFLGVNCSIMPGMAIEHHAQILPNARVGQ